MTDQPTEQPDINAYAAESDSIQEHMAKHDERVAEQEAYRDKLRSIGIGKPGVRHSTKTTVDKHDTHEVEITEYFDADRQDVTVKPKVIRGSLNITQGG